MDKSTSKTPIRRPSSSLPKDDQAEATIAGPSVSRTSQQPLPPPPAAKKPPGQTTPTLTKTRFTKQDMEFTLTWLEHRPNFESVFGSHGHSTTVGMPNQRKETHGYTTLAEAVSRQSKGRLTLSGKSMRERFQRHLKVYTSTRAKLESGGFGITEDDTRNGIYTVAHKLESICPCYARMDGLFGPRPNVNPMLENSASYSTKPSRRNQLIDEEGGEGEVDEDEDEDGNAGNTYTHGNNADSLPIDNTKCDNFDNRLYNDGADYQEDSARETRAMDDDEISVLSNPSAVFEQQSKRRLTYAGSQASNKRSRTTDRRNNPARLDPSSSRVDAHAESVAKKTAAFEAIETRKLDLEEQRLELDGLRLLLEQSRMRLEEDELKRDVKVEVLKLMAAGVAQGMSVAQIRELVRLSEFIML